MTVRKILRRSIHAAALLALVTALPSAASAQEKRRIEPVLAQESAHMHRADSSGAAAVTLATEPDSADSWVWPVAMMGAMVGAGLTMLASKDCGPRCISSPIVSAFVGGLIGGAVGFFVGAMITATRD